MSSFIGSFMQPMKLTSRISRPNSRAMERMAMISAMKKL